MLFFPSLTGLAMVALAINALRLNPYRPTNRIVAAIGFASFFVFAAQVIAKWVGYHYPDDPRCNPLPWVRLKFALIAIITPGLTWLCYYLVSGVPRQELTRKMTGWALLSAFLFGFAFTEGFKPNDSLPGNVRYGGWYLLYFGPIVVAQATLCWKSFHLAQRLSGIRQLEFLLIVNSLCYLSLAAQIVETVYATWPDIPGIGVATRLCSYLVYLVFCVCAWSVTCRYIYNRQQVFGSLIATLGLAVLIALPASWTLRLVWRDASDVWAACLIFGLAFWAFVAIHEGLRARLRGQPEERLLELREQLEAIADREEDVPAMMRGFEMTIAQWGGLTLVTILRHDHDSYIATNVRVPVELLRGEAAFREGWISSATAGRVRMGMRAERFFAAFQGTSLAALIAPGWGRTTPPLILGLGQRYNSLPFTYPDILLYRQIAIELERIYTTARLRLQAKQTAQLAAIGRAGAVVAHELRSPLWTLRTLTQLLPEKTHDHEFLRSVANIVPRESERVQRLTDQLLNMAKSRPPRTDLVDAHAVIGATIVILRHRAESAWVTITPDLGAEHFHVAGDAASLQQLMTNLIENAIEALEAAPSPRSVSVRTLNAGKNLRIEVEDTGAGISAAILPDLFSPFATFGKPGGTGLGLAICSDIATDMMGTLTAQNRAAGGARLCFEVPWSTRRLPLSRQPVREPPPDQPDFGDLRREPMPKADATVERHPISNMIAPNVVRAD